MALLVIASIPQLSTDLVLQGTRNLCYNLYSILEFVFWISLFFYNSERIVIRRLMIAMLISFALLTFVIVVNNDGLSTRFLHEVQCANSMAQVLLVLFYFYDLNQGAAETVLQRMPMFWFTSALLLYAPSTYFYFVFYEEVRLLKLYPGTRLIHNILNTLLYLLFAAGMFVNRYRNKPISAYDIV